VFDNFAPKLAAGYHVYGITRRGFGPSSIPAEGYGADRLGDDVLAVLDSLKLKRPVLVGHSLGGEELSSVGSRYPERVAGLVYLDAGYQYAFDNGTGGTLEELQKSANPQPPPPQPNEADRASFKGVQAWFTRIQGITPPEAEVRQGWDSAPDGRVGKRRNAPMMASIIQGMKKYTTIPVPALVIFAVPHDQGPWIKNHPDPAVREAAKVRSAQEVVLVEKQAKAFENGVPGAHVVRMPGRASLRLPLERDGCLARNPCVCRSVALARNRVGRRHALPVSYVALALLIQAIRLDSGEAER
jgi:pimeloyl-ACP methyl ester carboxylesterase